MFYVDVIKMEISCLSAGKSCEVQDLCASFRACAACRAVQWLLDKITAVQIEPSSHREDSARIKEMLTSTTRTITEISEMCGFSSLSSFGKVFRQHTGVTPVQYRSGL